MKKILLFGIIALALNSFGQVPGYVSTDGLSGWWSFNSSANDESVNGNNGTVNGAISVDDRFGSVNSAYYFDGIDDYIEIPHSPSIDFGGKRSSFNFSLVKFSIITTNFKRISNFNES